MVSHDFPVNFLRVGKLKAETTEIILKELFTPILFYLEFYKPTYHATRCTKLLCFCKGFVNESYLKQYGQTCVFNLNEHK